MSKLGKTNAYPRGKFNKDDEGELRLAIGVQDNTVIIYFGTPVTWLGFDVNQAIEFANAVKNKALILKNQQKGNKHDQIYLQSN